MNHFILVFIKVKTNVKFLLLKNKIVLLIPCIKDKLLKEKISHIYRNVVSGKIMKSFSKYIFHINDKKQNYGFFVFRESRTNKISEICEEGD